MENYLILYNTGRWSRFDISLKSKFPVRTNPDGEFQIFKQKFYKVANTPACTENVLIFAGLGPMPLPPIVWR